MRLARQRLFSVAVLAWIVWTVGTVVALVARWPAQFGGPGDPDNVATEFLSRGTVLSPPLFVMAALVVFVLLVPNRRSWGTLGVVGLCLLAVLTFVGSLGEAFAPSTPDVPRTALIASGVVGVLLCPALLLSGVAELVDRARSGRRPSRVS